VQLKKLAANNARRLELTRLYHEMLKETEVDLPFSGQWAVDSGQSEQTPSSLSAINHELLTSSSSLTTTHYTLTTPAAHLLPILLPHTADRTHVISTLKAAGIQTSQHYPPIHCFSYYQELHAGLSLPVTEDYARREVTLPLYPGMTDDLVSQVAAAITHALPINH
jgi:dTDP-4-amino-4,6-dideoxygalactose transaminase